MLIGANHRPMRKSQLNEMVESGNVATDQRRCQGETSPFFLTRNVAILRRWVAARKLLLGGKGIIPWSSAIPEILSPPPVTGFTDNGSRMRTLVTRGFVSLCLDEGKTLAVGFAPSGGEGGWWSLNKELSSRAKRGICFSYLVEQQIPRAQERGARKDNSQAKGRALCCLVCIV